MDSSDMIFLSKGTKVKKREFSWFILSNIKKEAHKEPL